MDTIVKLIIAKGTWTLLRNSICKDYTLLGKKSKAVQILTIQNPVSQEYLSKGYQIHMSKFYLNTFMFNEQGIPL